METMQHQGGNGTDSVGSEGGLTCGSVEGQLGLEASWDTVMEAWSVV